MTDSPRLELVRIDPSDAGRPGPVSWLVRDEDDRFSYTDPFRTRREAKAYQAVWAAHYADLKAGRGVVRYASDDSLVYVAYEAR
jgi:hypothetical protein